MRWDAERSERRPVHWLPGGGAMGEMIRSMPWSTTPLGELEEWPQCLRTALGICLGIPEPCCVAWGVHRMQLYNDPYARLCGCHPDAMGEDFAESWPEAWPKIRASFDRAFGGEPSLIEKQQVLVERDGVREDDVLSFSFVPVRDEYADVRGVLISLIDPSADALRLELSRARSDIDAYSYTISHDFRAPLRTMESMTRIVTTDYAPQLPADALRLLNHILTGAGKLGDRADALLHVIRLSQQPLSRRRVDVAALVNKSIAELRDTFADRRIDVVIEDLPAAEGDPELLRLVFTNILSNAFKFTRNTEHARIEIGSRPQQHQNVYYVRDSGAGFDMKYASRLFGFFQRLHSEGEFEGIGMGLALVRRLIERHGGTIWAEARKGEGATFFFTLPVCRTCHEA